MIPKEAKIVMSEILPYDPYQNFITGDGKEFCVNVEFRLMKTGTNGVATIQAPTMESMNAQVLALVGPDVFTHWRGILDGFAAGFAAVNAGQNPMPVARTKIIFLNGEPTGIQRWYCREFKPELVSENGEQAAPAASEGEGK